MLPNQPPIVTPDNVAVPPPAPHHIKLPSRNVLALLLAGLSMLGPFCIDAYLPAFPSIEANLHASALEVQQTITAYMLAFSVMVLLHGYLSDAFGRRNVVLWSLVVFAVGTFGCAGSHSVQYLWMFRIMQGMSAGAGLVVGRAIIRDLYSDAEAARLMSMVTMIFSIAPAIAPVMGGWIVQMSDWRTIFLSLFAYTLMLAVVCYRSLPETLPVERRKPFNLRFLVKSYGQILNTPLFHLKTGAVACNFGGLFLYISAAPVLLPDSLHLGPSQFGWLFFPSVGGIFLGAFTANRLAGRITLAQQVGLGFSFALTAALVNVVYHAFWPAALPWTFVPLFFFTAGISIVAPGATLLALDLFPHIRGTAASCQSATASFMAAVVAGVIAPVLSHSPLWMALGQLGFVLTGLGLWLYSRLVRRRIPREIAV